MPEPQMDQPSSENTPLPNRATIGQWSTDHYLAIVRWPAVILVTLVIGLVLTEQSQTLVIAIEILGAAWIGWLVERGRGRRTESLAAGAVIGILMGLAASLGRFIVRPSVAAIFGGISETLLTGLIVSLLATSALLIFSLRHSKN